MHGILAFAVEPIVGCWGFPWSSDMFKRLPFKVPKSVSALCQIVAHLALCQSLALVGTTVSVSSDKGR